MGLPRWLSNKESTCQCRRCTKCKFDPWVGKIPWRRKWQPTSVFSLGEFHCQRSLAGYSPWGCKESDMTEWLSTHMHIKILTWTVLSEETLNMYDSSNLFNRTRQASKLKLLGLKKFWESPSFLQAQRARRMYQILWSKPRSEVLHFCFYFISQNLFAQPHQLQRRIVNVF